MAGNELTMGLGFSLAIALMLLAIVVTTVRWQVVPALLSQLTLSFYLLLFMSQPSDSPHYLLFGALILALIGVGCYWRDMFRRVHNHLMPWTLVLVSIAVVLVNQLLFSSLTLFMLPIWLCSLAIVCYQFYALKQMTQTVSLATERLTKSEIAIGLDLSSGLPNKLAFTDKIDKRLMVNPNLLLNVVVLKLTQFDLLNSLIGHQNGDLVKLQMATRIRKILSQSPHISLLSEDQQTAFLATLGGVDFCFAVNDQGDQYVTEKLLVAIRNVINEPLLINATAVDVGVKFGVAKHPAHGGTVEQLLEHAYLALSHHNESSNSVFFDPKLENKLHVNRAVIGQLREDLRQNKFELFVQPQIDINNNRVEGGEVLIRWRRDDRGILAADKFIDLAIESGVIYQLSIWTFKSTIQKLAEMQKQGLDQYLAVNVSNKELFHTQLVETISQFLNQFDAPPERLVIEIKESAFAVDKERALKVTRLLSQLGVKIGIDEFGKDQSALSCFNQFTPCYVKIDCQSLNSNKGGDKTNTYLNALIGVARHLQIKTIAQGIELDSTIKQLKDVECDGAQGYYYSKPFELSGFDVWLEQWQKHQ